MYKNNKIRICTQRQGLLSAEINQGVRQGCPLSPTLFNIYIDDVVRSWLMKLNNFMTINNTNFTTLLFADDQIIGKTENEVQEAVYKLSQVAIQYGMIISTGKTKVMAFQGQEPIRAKIVIDGKLIEQINQFKYLGYSLEYRKSQDVEIKLNRFRHFCGTIQRTLKHNVRRETLLKLYKVVALPLLLYGCECWTLTSDQLRRIEASEMRFLRYVTGYTVRIQTLSRASEKGCIS